MPSYSDEFKTQVVRKMMPPNSQSVSQVSKEMGISVPTLYAWKNQYRAKGYVVPAKPSRPDQWDTRSKLAAIIQTASMNEAERSEYCRSNGLYPEQIDAWRQALESADLDGQPTSKVELAAERLKVKRLERELNRKDKALAETGRFFEVPIYRI